MNVRKPVALCALIGIASASVAFAQTPPTGGNSSSPQAASSPHQQEATGKGSSSESAMSAQKDGANPATFVKKAALGGMTEVELGKLAQSKAKDPKVKQFADRMVKDHTKANTELASIVKAKGMQVPASLDAEHKAIVQKLSAKSGADFDMAYSSQMMQDHEKTVALFEGAVNSSDSELAAFAQKTLPTLKEHEQMTETLPGSTHSADAGTSTPRRQ